jgi:hypothetical protein
MNTRRSVALEGIGIIDSNKTGRVLIATLTSDINGDKMHAFHKEEICCVENGKYASQAKFKLDNVESYCQFHLLLKDPKYFSRESLVIIENIPCYVSITKKFSNKMREDILFTVEGQDKCQEYKVFQALNEKNLHIYTEPVHFLFEKMWRYLLDTPQKNTVFPIYYL